MLIKSLALIIWFDSKPYIIPQKFPKSPKTFKIPKSALLGDEIPKVGQPDTNNTIEISNLRCIEFTHGRTVIGPCGKTLIEICECYWFILNPKYIW